MLPMLCREIIEAKELFFIFLKAFTGGRIFCCVMP
jgi:hypothetical protein